MPAGSIDFVATDPPYNVQLPMTMAGGTLAETHANRRTDYAMVSDLPDDLANLPDYPAFLDAMSEVLGEVAPRPAAGPLRGADRPRRLPGRAATCSPARTSPRAPPPRASCPRAT